MKNIQSLVVLCLLLAAGQSLVAQTGTLKNYNQFGHNANRSLKLTLSGGLASYNGDLNSTGEHINTIFGLGIIYKFAPHVSLKSEFSFYTLSGTDAGGRNWHRNLSFQSNNVEGYAGLMYELFDIDNPSRGRGLIINPYVFAGLGFTTLNPFTTLDGKRYYLRTYKTEDIAYSRSSMILPFGVGVRFEVSKRLGFSLEGAYRYAFTDYLDDVSTTYIGSANITDQIRARLADRGPEAPIPQPFIEAGSQRGSPTVKDGYATLTLKVEYLLWPFNKYKKPECPASTKMIRKPLIKRKNPTFKDFKK